jgi:hypothetical protein
MAGDERVQIIVSPAGERCAVVPEHEYLVAASKEDEGEPTPEFLAEIRRRSQPSHSRYDTEETLRNIPTICATHDGHCERSEAIQRWAGCGGIKQDHKGRAWMW